MSSSKIISKRLFVPLSLLMAFVFCSREYNPFSDYANAGLYITHQSIHDRDTLQIFSTESLQVRVTVKELVDRFSVSASANRLWPGAESTVVASQFPQEPFTFFVSFYDTGWQSIVTSVHRTDASAVSDTLHVYLKSPLRQDSVVAFVRDTVRLRTPRVKDRDVTYYWSLGPSTSFASPVCSAAVAATSAFYFGTGSVWVWDGRHMSPADSFVYYLRDTVKPSIVCVNEEIARNDTIFTSDSIFTLRVRITDDLGLGVDSASVNRVAFDGSSGGVYYKLFDKTYLHPSANALAFNIFALDNFHNANIAQKTYWLAFSATLPHAKKASLVVVSPAADTITVNTPLYPVSGTVVNNSLDSFNLSVYLSANGSIGPQVIQITEASPAWEWPVVLKQGLNPVRIVAMDNRTGATVDEKDLLLVYAPDAPDSVPPRILSVLANGVPAQGAFTDRPSAALAIEAIDDGTGIDTLFVNGAAVAASGFWYYDTVPLAHVPSGNQVAIRAVDKKQNAVREAVVIFRNNAPIIQRFPASAFVHADSTCHDTIRAVDPDNDSLLFQRTDGPAGLTVDHSGAIAWTPSVADTGAHSVTIRVFDGYQPVFATYTLYVTLPGQAAPKPVLFATRAEDFPLYLVAGRDSVHAILKVAQGTGIRPFLFSARIVGKKGLLLDNITDSVLSWTPALGDTGYNQIIANVKDQFPSTDTIYPRILVVPPQRPCSISVSYDADTLQNGAARLSETRQPFTMVFRVKDPDNPLVGRHKVTLFESISHTATSFDSALVDTFVYTVDPAIFTGYDTIVATVNDGVSADTIRVRLYFGLPPDTPAAGFPINFAVVNSFNPTLVFSGGDPDNDSLAYDLYFGNSPLSLSLIATTPDASATVSGLAASTTYYWKVVARDWKSRTASQVWQFTTMKVN